MKKTKKLSQKSKKTILAASVLGVGALIIGGTIAYSHDQAVMSNKFNVASYRTLFTETFDSPSGWKTCETIDKTITVKNEFENPVAVRIKIDEQWIASDGVTELPLVSATSGYQMAQINFVANSGWTKQGDYYYYDVDLPKNSTTTTPFASVTLNCDANLNVNDPTADGAYSNAKYHLKITAQTIEAVRKDEWSSTIFKMIEQKVNPEYTIDFTRKAIISDDTYTANGNGVDKYTEGGNDIYYYRGEVYDNNLIWADKCWKILRTTKTGGVKIIYNGEPSNVTVDNETVRQCLATGDNAAIPRSGVPNYSYHIFSRYGAGSMAIANSPGNTGYMYGNGWQVNRTSSSLRSNGAKIGRDFTYNPSTGEYSLVTTITISNWASQYQSVAQNYHFFCGTPTQTTCTDLYYLTSTDRYDTYAILMQGYETIDALVDSMFVNTNDSTAKSDVDDWFATNIVNGSRNYENDLEDAVFCNERTFYDGPFKSKTDSSLAAESHFTGWQRNTVKNGSNNLSPSLDCLNNRDAFTKDSANGNGALDYKVGLITADEMTMAGSGYYGYDSTAYLYTSNYMWTMTPAYFSEEYAQVFTGSDNMIGQNVGTEYGQVLRPVVSLKPGTEISSGTGLKTDPYIVD